MSKTISRLLQVVCAALISITVISCDKNPSSSSTPELSHVEQVIAEAETMDRNELYAKAIEELDGKTMNAVGNSSRGKTAQEYFIAYLQGKKYNGTEYVADATIRAEFPQYKENFSGKITWSQPKNNMIFAQISSDIKSSTHTLSMTLIQDGNQIQSKMLDTGYLLNYIPKEWAGDVEKNGHPFALQSLNKVFMFNNTGTKTFKNVWDFVAEGNEPLFMGVNSEPVGKNFLYMLTNEHYSNLMKEAYDGLNATQKTYFNTTINEVAGEAAGLGLTHTNAKYSLAWIKLWVSQYNLQTDDGPIATQLVTKSAADQSGLLVYSKLRSVTETTDSSKNNVTVAAYQDDYVGVGGFMYKHYLQILKTSPYPWTSAAFIHFMTTTKDGFSPWGKDIGGYCSNPIANKDHTKDGMDVDGTTVLFAAINDKGYEWWTNQETGGKMVIEDPAYVSQVSYSLGDWIDII